MNFAAAPPTPNPSGRRHARRVSGDPRTIPSARRFNSLGVSAALLGMALLALVAVSSVSSSASGGATPGRDAAANASAPGAKAVVAKLSRTLGLGAMAFQLQAPEAVQVTPPATRANRCNDPSFICLGEVATAQVSNAPLRAGFRYRRIEWVAPDGTVPRVVDVVNDPQTDTFTLPTTGAFAQVGTWEVRSINNRGFGVVTQTFEVRAPSLPSADLELSMSGPTAVSAGSGATYTLTLKNNGPDDAANVVLVNPVPFGTTFVSAVKDDSFTCATPGPNEDGTVECTAASLASGAQVVFTLSFSVNADVTDGLFIFNFAKAGTSTNEPNQRNNYDYVASKSAPPQPCTLDNGTCPGDITANAAQGQSGANVSFTPPTASGSCPSGVGEDGDGSAVSCDHQPGDFFPVGTTEVRCTAPAGDACVFNVTVNPNEPTIKLNGDNPMTVECSTGFVDPGATALAPTGESLPVTVSGSVNQGAPGDYVLTYSATYTAPDNSTTPVSATRTVKVVDTTAPTINLIGDAPMTVEYQTQFTDPGATADDGCYGDLTSSITKSGSVDVNTLGDYTITYSVTDAAGNKNTAERTVSVVDTTPPVISGVADVTATTGTGATSCDAVVTDAQLGTITANDNHDGSVSVTRTGVPSGNVFPAGSTTVTYTATDAAGNTATKTQTVTVSDDTKPTISAPAPVTANDDPSSCTATNVALGTPTTSDNCSAVTVTNDAPSVFPRGTTTVTWTARDAAGNTKTATQAVTVVDNQAPTLSASNIVVPTDPNSCTAVVNFNNLSATDNCDTPTVTTDIASGTAFAKGTTTVTATAADSSGNQTTKTFTVTVEDRQAPTITYPAAGVVAYLPLNSTATSTQVSFAVSATDNCSGVTLNVSPASGSVFPVGTTTVTATATDAAGNQTVKTFTVTVLYDFTGFFSPISNPPVLNTVNAGRAIPVKFSLSGNKGLNIFAAGYPASGPLTTNPSDPSAEVTETLTAGGSSLSYDASSDQYIYVWKTDSSWAGTSRQLVIKLSDGSTHVANFKFR
jgi:Bacterial surface protein, Ig-like domain/Domain of unknown function DUF11/HYR domain